MFLGEFMEKLFCEDDRSGGKELDVQEFVRFGIDSGVQLESFVVELNHGFVHRNVIRTLHASGL